MTKRQRELQAEILRKSQEANGYLEGETKDVEKAAALLDEVDALQKELDTIERAEKAKKAGVPAEGGAADGGIEGGQTDSTKAFADAARAGFKSLNEGTGAKGGYTVPEDIQTKVNEYKQERFSLATLIDRETVSTMAGKRTYKKRAQHTGFTQVAEGGKITKVASPEFELMEYKIKKYGGYMPVTNELLEDSDANIVNMMVGWLGEEDIATENAQILAKINEKEATPMTSLKDIKKAVNVDLAAFAGTVKIVTNADGLQYLDTLEDGNGRPLLSPDPVKPMEMYLSVGVRRIPVVVVPNAVLPSSEAGAIPFITGDLFEYVKQFDRKLITLKQSDEAVVGELNAYEQDLTLIRALVRKDWQIKDSEAIVRGELTPAVEG
jgi:HK97 family phage major capsid protein